MTGGRETLLSPFIRHGKRRSPLALSLRGATNSKPETRPEGGRDAWSQSFVRRLQHPSQEQCVGRVVRRARHSRTRDLVLPVALPRPLSRGAPTQLGQGREWGARREGLRRSRLARRRLHRRQQN
jgi:hypothetical protein